MDMKPQGTKKQCCSDSKGAEVEEAEDQGANAHKDMLERHGKASEPHLQCSVWPVYAQSEKQLRNCPGVKVKQR